VKFRPDLEQFEAKQLLSAGLVSTRARNSKDGALDLAAAASVSFDAQHTSDTATARHTNSQSRHRRKPAPPGTFGFLTFRVTNTPFQTPYNLIPPFQQVLVQRRQPMPGQVYNVGFVTVKNGTAQTFDASNGFTVRMTNQPRSFGGFPILTGNQQWRPGQILVFYVLTKKYYPVSFVSGGFQFNTGGRSSTAIPGPSGIFLRVAYKPETFARTLNWIVAFGPGNQGGKGAKFGLPNTAINQLVEARTQRPDFAGHF
jgi:hypothetical protein